MKINKFNEMLEEIQRDRGITKEGLIAAINSSLLSAAKKRFNNAENLEVRISDDGEFKVYQIEEGKEEDITPKDFGRFAAQTAKQVIIQRLRETEKEEGFDEFAKKQGEIVTGIVQRREYAGYFIDLGRLEAILTPSEQIPGEAFRDRERIKVYVVETRKTSRGPMVTISRSHPNLVKRLFEMEIPEIKEGILEIKGISREPGKRTKIAILSKDANVGVVGTCVGHMGARIQNIVKELGQERIDIVEWSENPKTFIKNALSPAKVVSVTLNEEEKLAKVVVAEKDLSLAIGKEGQNVRLAVKLTGWKIDLISEGGEKKENQTNVTAGELATELGVSPHELIEKLREFSFSIKAANSHLSEEAVSKAREVYIKKEEE
ncbi:MAG: transcription termination factor NusA [Candidatus Margulisiibacteriota bacterium]